MKINANTAFAFFLAVALSLLCGFPSFGAPVRITSWNLSPTPPDDTNHSTLQFRQIFIRESAAQLKKLDPDVILLQQVPDWGMCNEIAEALKPGNYQVALCSSFRDVNKRSFYPRQVAILSKTKAFMTWSQPWPDRGPGAPAAGGFAFMATRIANRNVGLISVVLGNGATVPEDIVSVAERTARDAAMQYFSGQIVSFQSWTTNQLDAIVVGGDLNSGADATWPSDLSTLMHMEQLGFDDAFEGLDLEKRVTWPGREKHPDAAVDYIFTQGAGNPVHPKLVEAPFTEHYAVTCELDLDAPRKPHPKIHAVPQPRTQLVVTPPVKVQAPITARASGKESGEISKMFVWPARIMAGCLTLLFVALWLGRRAEPEEAPPHQQPLISKKPVPRPRAAPIPFKPAPLPSEPVAPAAPPPPAPMPVPAPPPPPRPVAPPAPVLQPIRAPAPLRRPALPAPRPVPQPRRLPPPPAPIPIEPKTAPYVHIEVAGATPGDWKPTHPRSTDASARPSPFPEEVKAGVIASLSQWLKQKLTRRLLADRAVLLATQEEAVQKLLSVDQRLSKVEIHIAARHREYEQRIDVLNKQLDATREENRGLIRAKIALIKAEMEREKTRAEKFFKEQNKA